jgi:hypothetical protein
LALDPETLDKIRRGFPLRMDLRGQFFLGEDAITHPGVVALFRRGLDLNDTGEPIVRVDGQWTYLAVADCVLRVLRVDAEEGAPRLRLDDGRAAPLDPETLWEQTGRGLRCTVASVASGRPLSARFGNTAQMDLDAWIKWPKQGRPRLVVGESSSEIPERD